MAGMPGSRKTAYIGSTWNLIAESNIPTKLYKKVGSMPENYRKLEEISQQLLLYNDLKRTKEDEQIELRMTLCDKQGNEIDLNIPDSAGEIFRDLVDDRRIKKETAVRLRESDGILFFIYYKNMSREVRIPVPVCEDKEDKKKKEDKISGVQNCSGNSKGITMNKNREANQSEVVELLQALLELRSDNPELVNIRFVLSAWDMVEKDYGKNICPEEFMKKKFPLLYQFVITNTDRIKAEFWGISALGGDLNDQEDVKRLQEEEFNAIKVLPPGGVQSNDLTDLLYGIGEGK